jgi:regulatory protein
MDEVAAVNPIDIRRAAIDLLARREHSFKELQVKLCRRFAAAELVEQQLDALVDDGLQSDRRFCETFVRSKCGQGQGPQRISQQLQQRGIEDALVQELLWQAGIDWHELLLQLYRRRYADKAPADQKDRAKRMRFLQYRGFNFEQIRQVLP